MDGKYKVFMDTYSGRLEDDLPAFRGLADKHGITLDEFLLYWVGTLLNEILYSMREVSKDDWDK